MRRPGPANICVYVVMHVAHHARDVRALRAPTPPAKLRNKIDLITQGRSSYIVEAGRELPEA